MKQISLFAWLSLLVIFSTALTCTAHPDVPPTVRFRVKMVNYVKPGGFTEDGVYTLSYDGNGRLSTFVNERDAINSTRRTLVTYYPNNEVSISTSKNGSPAFSYGLFYYFDAQSRLIRMRHFLSPNIKVVYDFVYNGNSLTPSSRLTTRYESGVPTGSKTETYTYAGANATTINGTSYTYDSSPNPYKGLFGFNAFSTLSPDYSFNLNNLALNRPFNISERCSDSSVKVFNQNNRTTNAQLTYNSDGLVTKIAYTDGNSEEFTYETY